MKAYSHRKMPQELKPRVLPVGQQQSIGRCCRWVQDRESWHPSGPPRGHRAQCWAEGSCPVRGGSVLGVPGPGLTRSSRQACCTSATLGSVRGAEPASPCCLAEWPDAVTACGSVGGTSDLTRVFLACSSHHHLPSCLDQGSQAMLHWCPLVIAHCRRFLCPLTVESESRL